MKVINTRGMTARESSTPFNTKENSNNKEAYPDGSKSTGRKVGFAAVFADITRRGTLPEETSIQTAEMIATKVAMKGVKKREDMRWVIYTDSLSSIQLSRKLSNIKSDI